MKLSADRNIHILIAVAEADRSITTGLVPLRPTRPSFRDIYIERVNGVADSFDVPTLSNLLPQLTTPFEQWPTLDFETTTTQPAVNPQLAAILKIGFAPRACGQNTCSRANRCKILASHGLGFVAESVGQIRQT